MRDVRIMDIAMNLSRIGNWAADDFDGKEKRIKQFLDQTKSYLLALESASHPRIVLHTLHTFRKVFNELTRDIPQDRSAKDTWAEAMLTWSNILTHRARLYHET